MSLKEYKDAIAKKVYGETTEEANQRLVCISCKKDVSQEIGGWSPIDQKEYSMSGMCPQCWDAMAKAMEQADEQEPGDPNE